MNTSEMKGMILWLIIGGTIGAVLGMWIGYMVATRAVSVEENKENEQRQEISSDDVNSMTDDGALIGSSVSESGDGALVSVQEQPAGLAVVVASIDIPRNGWIAIHEILDGALIGNVLGAARRDAGLYEGVVVNLLRATEPGSEYAVVLYVDNGNKEFDLQNDVPITDAAGNPTVVRFSAVTPPSPSGN